MMIIDKTQQIEVWDFFMNDQNIMFGYTPPIKIRKIEKCQSINFDECSKNILIYPFLRKEYNVFSPNNESFLEK